MRIALVNPPFSRLVYGEEHSIKSITPCLGLFYLQSYCRDVAELEVFEGEFYRDLDDLISSVRDFRPDVLGVTTNTTTYPYCVRVAQEIDCLTKIAGGPYASFRVEECLKDFDAVCLGDGEVSLRSLALGTPPSDVPGLAFRRRGGFIGRNPPAPQPELDSIPFPDHSKMRLGLYQASPHRELPEPFATMVTTRGCGFACTFCLSAAGGMNGGRYRERSVANVMQELTLLTEKHGVRSVQFWDDTFTMKKQRTRELCAALKTTGIAYICNTRTDKMDRETADLLASSGCRGVFFGVESGAERILDDNMRKGVHNEQVRTAIANCRQAGMRSTASFIFGAIDDTEETIEETIQFALSLKVDYVLFNIYTAHPGTEGYQAAVGKGLIDEYEVDLSKYHGEPVGVPTICRALRRVDLHRMKAEAYVRYYRQLDPVRYAHLIRTYQDEIQRLNEGVAGRA